MTYFMERGSFMANLPLIMFSPKSIDSGYYYVMVFLTTRPMYALMASKPMSLENFLLASV